MKSKNKSIVKYKIVKYKNGDEYIGILKMINQKEKENDLFKW